MNFAAREIKLCPGLPDRPNPGVNHQNRNIPSIGLANLLGQIMIIHICQQPAGKFRESIVPIPKDQQGLLPQGINPFSAATLSS
jgi:hypothetical protein